MVHYNTVIVQLFNELDSILNQFVFNSYATLAQHLQTPLFMAGVIYIMLMGYAVTAGWVKLSMSAILKSVIHLGLVFTFALHWDFFSRIVVTGIEGGSGELASWLMQSVQHAPLSLDTHQVNDALQKTFSEFAEIGHYIWARASWRAPGPYMDALVVWISGFVLVAIAVFELALSKIMLAVLFGMAPLFLGFTLFKPTHGFFDRWLGAIAGYAFVFLFVSAILALVLSLAEWSIAGVLADKAEHISTVSFLPIALVCLLGIGITLSVSRLAQAIGGTVTTASSASLLAGTVGGAIAMKVSAGKTAPAQWAKGQTAKAGEWMKKGGARLAGQAFQSTMKRIRLGDNQR
jgi:type IV secretion system protein VirB6